MARGNVPFIAFNRGLISETALARVDLDRTRLSATLFNNWLPKTQGNMIIRPGTKKIGNTFNDTGSQWVEFVAATNDVALVELSNDTGNSGVSGYARFWVGTDAHNLSLIERGPVATTVNFTDTGWYTAHLGGTGAAVSTTDYLPTFGDEINGNYQVSASSERNSGGLSGGDDYGEWRAVSNNTSRLWWDTGVSNGSQLPSWYNIDHDKDGTDTGLYRQISGYSIRAPNGASTALYAPGIWRLLGANYDTGTWATDTGKWTLEDEQSGVTWSANQKRTYSIGAFDTGTVGPYRHYRFHIVENSGGPGFIIVNEFELFSGASAAQAQKEGGRYVLNARSIGGLARIRKKVTVDTGDQQAEHSVYIDVERGPVNIRIGSSEGDENLVSETSLGTGYHNLAFTPGSEFHVTLQTDEQVDRIINEFRMSDTGTLLIQTPWIASDLSNVRYDQSADVVFLDCKSVHPQKIERRGTGRSWSVVKYQPNDGPLKTFRSSGAKLKLSGSTPNSYGNVTIDSDIPFFTPERVGSLLRLFQTGQNSRLLLGNEGALSPSIEVTGIGDTGAPTEKNERRILYITSGTYTGGFVIERSFDGPDIGFKEVNDNSVGGGNGFGTDTGTRTYTIDDQEDNIKVWYRARMNPYTSGAATLTTRYGGGSTTGIARITSYNSPTSVEAEILSHVGDTGGRETEDWEEGYWSDELGYPTSIAFHGGRLFHAQGGSIFGSVADDYESFDDDNETDSAPIIRTLGSGPVDNIHYLVSLLRLIVGTAGAEIAVRSSSLDEPLTPENSNARAFSTQGSANIRALKMDTNALFIQRSTTRLFLIGFGLEGDALGDYKNSEMTFLVPDLLSVGVRSIAIQRQPDTRIHCVMNDGTVCLLTYEPQEEVLAWSTWSTDTGTNSSVEEAMVLPGAEEDAVFYQIKRTINGTTSRFLEKWALESECIGDTGLHWLADCAVSFTDTGRTNTITGLSHLIGQTVVGWGSLDSGTYPHIDLTPGDDGAQSFLTVDTGGAETLSYTEGVHHAVIGLPYKADWQSTKLAYGAEAGTALTQMKRTDKMGFILLNTHNNALFFGHDTGTGLDPLPRVNDEGETVDQDKIFPSHDSHAVPFPGLWDEDSRIHLRAIAPRPANVLALVPTINTNEKV